MPRSGSYGGRTCEFCNKRVLTPCETKKNSQNCSNNGTKGGKKPKKLIIKNEGVKT